jgi:protein SCO1
VKKWLVLFLLVFGLASTAAAGAADKAPPEPVSRDGDPAARQYFTDVELLDQDGRSHRLFTDLLQDRVVVVSAFFTSCLDSCPIAIAKLAELQSRLGKRLGDTVNFLSLTVDPVLDTPPILRAFTDQVGAMPGWYFLTGDEPNVALARERFGFHGTVREAHSNLILLGNVRTGMWVKAFGPQADPEDLSRLIDQLLAEG